MTDLEFDCLKNMVLAYGAPAIIEMIEYIVLAETESTESLIDNLKEDA